MDEDESHRSRRRFLQLTGTASLVGIAGCLGKAEHDPSADRAEGEWCLDELDEPVRESERTAESIDGVVRNPGELISKEDAGYKCGAMGAQLCANCHFFIPSKGNDMIGACALVAGRIRSQDWCARYQPTERLPARDYLPERPPLEFGTDS